MGVIKHAISTSKDSPVVVLLIFDVRKGTLKFLAGQINKVADV